jgi:hypothetical protein
VAKALRMGLDVLSNHWEVWSDTLVPYTIRPTHIPREGRRTSHGAGLSSYASGRILIQGHKM